MLNQMELYFLSVAQKQDFKSITFLIILRNKFY